jgi:hypothetical protein
MNTNVIFMPHKTIDREGYVTIASRVNLKGIAPHQFYFRFPERLDHKMIDRNSNHHLIAHIMPAMRVGGKLKVEGKIDAALLKNLQTYMRYWARWCPDRFRIIDIEPEETVCEDQKENNALISCFSGGVDSWYSCLRSEKDYVVPLKSLMFMHGHDLDLSRRDYYNQLANRYQEILQIRELDLIRIETNARETSKRFHLNWGNMAHGVFLAAAMHVFSDRHSAGCIPSSDMTTTFMYPWGTNPITDPLLSSSSLKIDYHDRVTPKFDKLEAIVANKDAASSLRVCFYHHREELNCGKCTKCVRYLIKMHILSPNSWRAAFPNIKNIEHAMKLVRSIPFIYSVFQQFLPAFDFSRKSDDVRFLKDIKDLVVEKHQINLNTKIKMLKIWNHLTLKIRLMNRKMRGSIQ